jgi:membrane protease YdiL (CAAX protease family)
MSEKLHKKEVDNAYQQLLDHGHIGIIFLLGSVFLFTIPTFLSKLIPHSFNTLLFSTADILWRLLPICAFLRLDRKILKSVLRGTLSYKQAIIIGVITGIICVSIRLSDYLLRNALLAQLGVPGFQGKGAVELLVAQSAPVLKLFGSPDNIIVLVYNLVFIGILGPFSEETLFQGWLQTRIANKMRPVLAALIVTLFFHLVHAWVYRASFEWFSPFSFTILFLLAIIRMKTGSLFSCSIAHATTNLCWMIMWIVLGVRK